MKRDARSFRVALVADQFVNPPPGGIDGIAAAAQAGWGVVQLPADDYPAAGRAAAPVRGCRAIRGVRQARLRHRARRPARRAGRGTGQGRACGAGRHHPREPCCAQGIPRRPAEPAGPSRDRPGRRIGSGARLQLARQEREPGSVRLHPPERAGAFRCLDVGRPGRGDVERRSIEHHVRRVLAQVDLGQHLAVG